MIHRFKRPMRKVSDKNGKLKEYNISLGVNTEINEDRFYKNDNDKIVCDVLICFPDEYEKLYNEHEEFQSKIQELEKTISDHEKTIENLENQLYNIEESNDKKIGKIEDEYSGKVDELNKAIHEKDIEIEKVKTEYEKKIGDLKEDHQKEINHLELFDGDKYMKITDHQKAMEDSVIFNPEYHMKREDHQKELNKMRGNCLKLRVRENKEYSSYIDDLDSLGRWDKFRNKDKTILKEMKLLNKQTLDEDAIDVNFNLIK